MVEGLTLRGVRYAPVQVEMRGVDDLTTEVLQDALDDLDLSFDVDWAVVEVYRDYPNDRTTWWFEPREPAG